MRIKPLIAVLRPFTLMYPAMAIISGGILGYNHFVKLYENYDIGIIVIKIVSGALIAAFLNGVSNIINQVCDVNVDRINKPERPIACGDLSIKTAIIWAILISAVIFPLAFQISRDFFILCTIALICTSIYSIPPVRLKRYHWYANLIIAIPRGLLLIVAGWATVAPINILTPWLFGSILFIFILGANTAKDFSDIEGDQKNGIISLPIKYGDRIIDIIKPFFLYPFILIIPYCTAGLIPWMYAIIVILTYPSFKALKSLKESPNLREIDNNHPGWKLMYLIVIGYSFLTAFLSFFAL